MHSWGQQQHQHQYQQQHYTADRNAGEEYSPVFYDEEHGGIGYHTNSFYGEGFGISRHHYSQHQEQYTIDPTSLQQQQHQMYYRNDPSSHQEPNLYKNEGYSIRQTTLTSQQPQHFYGDPSQQYPYYTENHQGYYDTICLERAAGWNTMEANTPILDPRSMIMMDPSWQTESGSMDGTPVLMTQQSIEKGKYYQESELCPDLLSGHAVNSIAYDPSYQCMYLAGTTQNMSSTRFQAHRASLLMTYTTTTTTIQSQQTTEHNMLYSSVAGHPEASSTTMEAIYQAMYGIPKITVAPPSVVGAGCGRGNHPPSHAYLPAYGGGGLTENSAISHLLLAHPQRNVLGHLGINELLPLGEGYLASVSPSAVRIHSYGGYQLSDHPIEGMLCGTIHPHSADVVSTHVTIGGLSLAALQSDKGKSAAKTSISATSQYYKENSNVHCLDLWQGLCPIYSRTFKDQATSSQHIAVTALATSHDRGSIVAGCSDGNIRLLDGSLREMATIKSHAGGVSSISISQDGLLIATTGFSGKANAFSSGPVHEALFAFPDPNAYVYDIRYLGRGGIVHPFAGVKGAPRHIRFLPDMQGIVSNRILVASGKPGGGVQILTPFEPQDGNTTDFLIPPLQPGESMTALSRPIDDGDELAIGTSKGRVMTFRLSGYSRGSDPEDTKTNHITKSSRRHVEPDTPAFSSSTSESNTMSKQPLDMSAFEPDSTPLSLDPTLLQGDLNLRNGTSEEMRSIFGTYTLLADPRVTYIGNTPEEAVMSFGPIGNRPIVNEKRRTVAKSLLEKASIAEREFMLTIPTSELGIDLLANHNIISKSYQGKEPNDPIANPNKTLYCAKISEFCYENVSDGKKVRRHDERRDGSGRSKEMVRIPPRYQLQVRPGFKVSGSFDPSDYNDTGLFPGWDYEPSMPNSWVCPVLLILYFVPELRASALASQFGTNNNNFGTKSYDNALLPELGFVFDQMERLSRYGLLYPSKGKNSSFRAKIGPWIPSNLLGFISTMAEAEQLQILDGSPAAVDRPRRPEAFYRFLAYQVDKELSTASSTTGKLMDSLNGFDYLGSNQFIESKSSPPKNSVTRGMTLDLKYDMVPPGADKPAVRFGELLQHSLCRETRLRAWNSETHAYETIVQRKITISLPRMLTITCACAGRKEEDGLWAWRTDHGHEPWLPELIAVELLPDGNVEVTEFHQAACGSGEIATKFRGKAFLPEEVSKIVLEASSNQKYRYRLEAVLSFVTNSDADDTENAVVSGHHILHARVSKHCKRSLAQMQSAEARKLADGKSSVSTNDALAKDAKDVNGFVLNADVFAEELEKRAADADARFSDTVDSEDESATATDWVLYNGFKVSEAFGEDARAFHVPFKEPVIVIFHAIDEHGCPIEQKSGDFGDCASMKVPAAFMTPHSLSRVSTGSKNEMVGQVQRGRPLAFDAEFVAVEEELATLTEAGQKLVIRETRHALGRISIFDSITEDVLIDDHVLPREPVVDYLTRFSGIVGDDLDPAKAKHRIISTRSAYLQMRYLLEQGCIYVGHGLKQDFGTINLVVPPHQIIDTVEIFHLPGMRFLSLRFLANYVLERDMQQDTHDSVEDARAAFELYRKAVQWKEEGVWDQRLQEMYAYGEKTSWKIGVDQPS